MKEEGNKIANTSQAECEAADAPAQPAQAWLLGLEGINSPGGGEKTTSGTLGKGWGEPVALLILGKGGSFHRTSPTQSTLPSTGAVKNNI